jgi:transcriptional regulator with XRE-family HTH domain
MGTETTASLVEKMRCWCKENGVTQTELGVRLGISPQGVTEIFKGRNQPTGTQVLLMQEMLNSRPKKRKEKA